MKSQNKILLQDQEILQQEHLNANQAAVLKFALLDMDVSITRTQDTSPLGRIKWIHPLGSRGKVKFVFNDAAKKYSGLLQGADYGIERLSLAALNHLHQEWRSNFSLIVQLIVEILYLCILLMARVITLIILNTFTNIVSDLVSFKLQLAAFLTFKRVSKCPNVLSLGYFSA